jgi:predicted PurR-regulated permease PerM
VLGAVVSAIISFLMFVVAFYYMLADGPRLIEATEELIPVHIEYQRQLLTQFTNIIRAVLLATFVAAIGQGMATAIGLAVVGFGHFFVFAIVATLAALIPLAGTWMVWVPCAAWLGWNGHWGKAIFLTIYGLAFVGMLDNVIRTYVLQSNAKLHPLLAFVSVLGGVQVMGLWGVFIGPMVACCLHALVKIFNTELRVFSQEKWLRWLETSTPDLRATASPALMAKLGPGLTVSSPPPAAAPPTSPGAPLPKVEP